MLKGALKATVAYAVLMIGLGVPALALAQTGSTTAKPSASPSGAMPLGATPPAATMTATVKATTVPATTLPAPSTAASLPVGTTTVSAATVMPGGMPPGGMASDPLSQAAPTPHIVQDAMNGLQKTDPINLDDMIRAQDAINRLDLMLEIEKRQGELKKLRDERTKPNLSLSSGIPASALNLPPMKMSSSPPPATTMPSAPPPPSSSYSLKRIVGTEGRYSAVLADGDKVVSVRTGESLPDGSKVKSITLTSVSLVKDKKSKTLTIPSDSYIVRGSEELIP